MLGDCSAQTHTTCQIIEPKNLSKKGKIDFPAINSGKAHVYVFKRFHSPSMLGGMYWRTAKSLRPGSAEAATRVEAVPPPTTAVDTREDEGDELEDEEDVAAWAMEEGAAVEDDEQATWAWVWGGEAGAFGDGVMCLETATRLDGAAAPPADVEGATATRACRSTVGLKKTRNELTSGDGFVRLRQSGRTF